MHRLPWGSPAPIYVRFAIPRTEKRQCLCSGQPVPLPQYTYTLHYDANGGGGAPPSQSVDSSEFHVWVPISEIIPTRDGYTFMGWANSRTGKPIYGGSGGYTSCLVVHGYDMSTTIYAIWEVHNHSWGEWTSNGNGTQHTHLHHGQQPYRNRQLLRRQGHQHGEGHLRNLSYGLRRTFAAHQNGHHHPAHAAL
ncbi:MAG: InlB B-repeat-containing protein [Blautia wexlerae]